MIENAHNIHTQTTTYYPNQHTLASYRQGRQYTQSR